MWSTRPFHHPNRLSQHTLQNRTGHFIDGFDNHTVEHTDCDSGHVSVARCCKCHPKATTQITPVHNISGDRLCVTDRCPRKPLANAHYTLSLGRLVPTSPTQTSVSNYRSTRTCTWRANNNKVIGMRVAPKSDWVAKCTPHALQLCANLTDFKWLSSQLGSVTSMTPKGVWVCVWFLNLSPLSPPGTSTCPPQRTGRLHSLYPIIRCWDSLVSL